MQHRYKSEIDVFRKEAVNVYKMVIYIRIGKWSNNGIIMIAMISLHYIGI